MNMKILSRDFPLDRKSVIPAQAGIQLIKDPCKAGQNQDVVRCAEYQLLLDSRLRGNDGAIGKSGLNQLPFRQRGAASIAIAMLLMFILVAAVTGVMNTTSTAVFDAATNSDQIAALFLAESGQERAQATLAAAARTGTNTNTSCTALKNQSANLGRGHFNFVDAVSSPILCGGLNTACVSCTVTVRGNVGASSRNILTQLSANRSDGVEGRTNSTNSTQNLTPAFTLNLKTTQNNSATFTHLIYNPITNWGGDAVVGACLNSTPGTSLTACTQSWKIAGTYYNNSASQGIFAQVPTPGFYSITESLTDPLTANPVDSRRNYVMVGITLKGLVMGTVNHVGSYAHATSGCPTVSNPRTQPVTANCSSWDYQHGYLPANWTCNPNSGTTPNWPNAANADTMIIGFGGKPYRTGACYTGTAYQMSNISLNSQPFVNQVKMLGTQCDATYSQIWYTYNPGYYATTANATNLALASTFTGTMGANITGHTTNGASRFVLDSDLGSDEVLSVGDRIMSTSGSTYYGTIASLRSGTGGQSGAIYNMNTGTTISATGTSLLSYSTVLSLTSAPSSGSLALNDSIRNTTGTTTYGNLSVLLSGALNTAGSTYRLSGGSPLQISSSTNNLRSYRTSTTITLTGATTLPEIGTALGVVSGTGAIYPDNVAGCIGNITSCSGATPSCSGSGNTLRVCAITGVTNLSAGDALFGAQLKVNTVITARVSGVGGTGTYTVTPSQTAASITITVRAAVVSVTHANLFTISRLPDTTVQGAQLCGGLCPFLLSDGTNPVGRFDLTSIVNYDDWSAGFACLSGVDPDSIETVGTIMSKRSAWSEPVQ